MKRKASVVSGIVLTIAAPLLFGQEMQQPAPQVPEDLLASASELIVWSSMQKPKPVPEPLPPPDKGVPQPDPQTQQPPAPQAPSDQVSSQTFTGKIMKDGDKYVLKVSSTTTYQLDEQSGAKEYENKDVKVVGTLDAGSNTIHVTKIELLS